MAQTQLFSFGKMYGMLQHQIRNYSQCMFDVSPLSKREIDYGS